MANWILHVVILWQTMVLSKASLSKLNCFEILHREKSAKLVCPGGIIASVNVKSGRGSCTRAEGRCYGNTPSLLVNYHTCYWRNNCNIKWPSGLIYAAENGGSCTGKYPTFMEIGYKCFTHNTPERILLDICNNLDNGKSVSVRALTRNTAGLIRSHNTYPWNYSNDRRFCSIKFYWPINQKLIVTVHNIDLSEGDTLFIGKNTDRRMISDETLYFQDVTETFFNFTVGTESNNGAGFVLCFKFVEYTDGTVTDACHMVMDDGVFNTERLTPRFEVNTSLHALTTTAETLPKHCKKRRSDTARRRCAARYRQRQRNNGKNENRRNRNRKMKNAKKGSKSTDS